MTSTSFNSTESSYGIRSDRYAPKSGCSGLGAWQRSDARSGDHSAGGARGHLEFVTSRLGPTVAEQRVGRPTVWDHLRRTCLMIDARYLAWFNEWFDDAFTLTWCRDSPPHRTHWRRTV